MKKIMFVCLILCLFAIVGCEKEKPKEEKVVKKEEKKKDKYETEWDWHDDGKGVYMPICVGFEDEVCEETIEAGTYKIENKYAKDIPNTYNVWIVDKKYDNYEALSKEIPKLPFYDGSKEENLEVKKGQYIYVEDIVTEGTGHLKITKK